MSACQIQTTCTSTPAPSLQEAVEFCRSGRVEVTSCVVTPSETRFLRAAQLRELQLTFTDVTGVLDLSDARLASLQVVRSTLESVQLDRASIDRVLISNEPGVDAYQPGSFEVQLAEILHISAVGGSSKDFKISAIRSEGITLDHLQIKDTLELSLNEVSGPLSARFVSMSFLEAPRLKSIFFDLFGARLSQGSIQMGRFGAVDLSTSITERALNVSGSTFTGELGGFGWSCGALDISDSAGTWTVIQKLGLGQSRIGSLVLSADALRAPQTENPEVAAPGLRLESVQGNVESIVKSMLFEREKNLDTLHSVEVTVRKGGQYGTANKIAFATDPLQALVSGKVPAEGMFGIACMFIVCFLGATLCCATQTRRWLDLARRCMCALDIVLPNLIDLGALKAWSNYDNVSRSQVAVRVRAHGWAFTMRLLGTLIVGYFLLCVGTLRG